MANNNKILTNVVGPAVDEQFPTVTGTTVGNRHTLDVDSPPLALAWDTTTTANVVYVGYAVTGAITSASVWRIMNVNTSTGRVTWADGDGSSNNVWDDRASLTYV